MRFFNKKSLLIMLSIIIIGLSIFLYMKPFGLSNVLNSSTYNIYNSQEISVNFKFLSKHEEFQCTEDFIIYDVNKINKLVDTISSYKVHRTVLSPKTFYSHNGEYFNFRFKEVRDKIENVEVVFMGGYVGVKFDYHKPFKYYKLVQKFEIDAYMNDKY